MSHENYTVGSRWTDSECRVWEKREWGWQFIGVAKSLHINHIMELISIDCDHPQNLFHQELK